MKRAAAEATPRRACRHKLQNEEDEDCEEWEAREDGSFCRVYHPALDQPALKQVAVSLESLGLAIDSDLPPPVLSRTSTAHTAPGSTTTAAHARTSTAHTAPGSTTTAAHAGASWIGTGTVHMEHHDSSPPLPAACLGKTIGTDRHSQPPPKRPKTKS